MIIDDEARAKQEAREDAQAKREIAETLFDGNNFVKIDNEPIIKPGRTIKQFVEEATTRIRQAGGRELLDQFFEKFSRAAAEYRHRREVYENPRTKPAKTADYPLHFIVNVDTKVGWVDEASWEKCAKKKCAENGGPNTGWPKPTDADLGY